MYPGQTKGWSLMTDKYAVRQYVKDKSLENILIPLLGVWDNANNVDFQSLPIPYILMSNNGSGDKIVVTDKDNIDQQLMREQLNIWLRIKCGVLTAILNTSLSITTAGN